MLLCLHVAEIAGRRLLLFAMAPAWLRARVPSLSSLGARGSRLRPLGVASALRRKEPETPAAAPATLAETVPDPAAVSSAMARAKSKAKSRIER